MRTALFTICALSLAVAPAAASELADRVANAPDGKVRMSYEAREGVRGNGDGITINWNGNQWYHGRSSDWTSDYDAGPVRALLKVEDGVVTRLETFVGGHWRRNDDAVDLGLVDPDQAAEFFLDLARHGNSRVADDAISAAVFADATRPIWPELIAIARDRDCPRDVRKDAVFWAGQEASAKVTGELEDIAWKDDPDIEVRKQAVFALSQRDPDEAFPVLARVATQHDHPEMRKNALFWLTQLDDPRVVDLIEGILLGD